MPRSPSSRQLASSPSSRGGSLARKRTLPTDSVQGTQRMNSLGGTMETTSSPVSSTGDSYRGQSPRRGEAGGDGDAGKLLSSPASVYSSPDMTRSVSAHSIFGPPSHLHQQGGIASSPLARSGSLDVVPTKTRSSPVKRRRTLCEPLPPSSPTMAPRLSPPSFKRWYGREGENVWPPEVDEAFFHALHLLPRLGRKKLLIDGKARGRNELISNYIYRTTGQQRSRKQVSSHIQVLKNMYRHDPEFMELVSEPDIGSDRFVGDNARLFFGDESEYAQPGSFVSVPSPPSIDIDAAKGYSTQMQRSESMPTLHSPFVLHPAHGAATPTTELSYAFQDMSVLASPPLAQPAPSAFLLGEIEMTMRGENIPVSDDDHESTRPRTLCRGDWSGSDGLNTISIEDLPTGQVRYSALLESMPDRQCQALHAKLYLDIPLEPTEDDWPSRVDTRISLRAAQALSLTVVTTVYCHGEQVIQFAEPLATPVRSTTTGPESPRLAPIHHQYSYAVPFASTYWSHFLSSGPNKSIGCSGDARHELAQSLSMFSVVQEFAFTPNAGGGAFPPIDEDSEMGVSGDLGEVVLVVAYDLELSDDASRKGTVEISRLETPPTLQEISFSSAMLPPLPPIAMSRSMTMPVLSSPPASWSPTVMSDMAPPLSRSTSSSRSFAPYKPNLSLHIPPASHFVRPPYSDLLPVPSSHGPIRKGSAPSTPWEQLVHTPLAPPPVLHDPFAEEQQTRLENIWLQNAASEWDLHSPALLGVSQPEFETGEFEPAVTTTHARFDPAATYSLHTPVPMQSSVSTPVYGTYHDAFLPPASEALRAFASTPDELVLAQIQDAASSQSLSRATSEQLQGIQSTVELTVPAEIVPAMSTSSSSTGSSASTAPTEPENASVPRDPVTSSEPPSSKPGDARLDAPDKAKVKLEQDFFSELLGAKTK
ncbi:hypothetical protein RHOSPDRAFT_31971 [Rhodotorula sp. JG-1b]|nr:hypothetical protein RHOSPDRAFT_31971 [Rhodotorula sp. JG-1b]